MIRWIKNLNNQLVGSGISKVYVTRPGLIGAVALGVVIAALAVAAVFPTIVYNLRTKAYSVELVSSGGLSAGDPVYVTGVPAGRVESVNIEGDTVVADFRVDRALSLGERTEAEVKLRTILGAYYLDVRPKGDGELPDARIPVERTGVPFHFDEIARNAYNAVRTDDPERETINYDQIAELTDLAYASIPDRQLAEEATAALADAAGIINRNGDQIREVFRVGKDIADIVDSQQATLEQLFDQGSIVFGTLGARAQLISGLIVDLESVATRINQLLTANPGEWDRLIINLRSMVTMLAGESARIDEALNELGPALRTVVDATGNGPWLDVNSPSAIAPDNLLCLLGALEGCR